MKFTINIILVLSTLWQQSAADTGTKNASSLTQDMPNTKELAGLRGSEAKRILANNGVSGTEFIYGVTGNGNGNGNGNQPDSISGTGECPDFLEDTPSCRVQDFCQCDGSEFEGCDQCATGSSCVYMDIELSMCVPRDGAPGGQEHTRGCVTEDYEQCGGFGFDGCQRCKDGSVW